jgi:hypothetical protein
MSRNFTCGYNIPKDGVRLRTSWPLAMLSVTGNEIRIRGRGPFRRLGTDHVLRVDQVNAAQAVRSRFGGGVVIEARAGDPWYVFAVRPGAVLDGLRSAGVNILAGSRRITVWDQT